MKFSWGHELSYYVTISIIYRYINFYRIRIFLEFVIIISEHIIMHNYNNNFIIM